MLSERSISNEGFFLFSNALNDLPSSSTAPICRSISRSYSKSSQFNECIQSIDEADMEADSTLHKVDDSLNDLKTTLTLMTRKNSRCMEPMDEDNFDFNFGMEKTELSAADSESRMPTVPSRNNSTSMSSKNSLAGKRSISAGYMVACEHPYDDMELPVPRTTTGLVASAQTKREPLPKREALSLLSVNTVNTPQNQNCPTVPCTPVKSAKNLPHQVSELLQIIGDEDFEGEEGAIAKGEFEGGKGMMMIGKCTEFGWNLAGSLSAMVKADRSEAREEGPAIKKRRITVTSRTASRKLSLQNSASAPLPALPDRAKEMEKKDTEQSEDQESDDSKELPSETSEQKFGEISKAQSRKLLECVARTEGGQQLLELACNSNKKTKFSFDPNDPESIPEGHLEQVIARITYDPSMKGTSNRSDHQLPARNNMPPTLESLASAGKLDGVDNFCMQLHQAHETQSGAMEWFMTCDLDGASCAWARQACTACGSCFSRFMYEEGKYTEFRKITREIQAGKRDWSELEGHTLCEPCYRHFTKRGNLNTPRRLKVEQLQHTLPPTQDDVKPSPPAKTRPRKSPAAKSAAKRALTRASLRR